MIKPAEAKQATASIVLAAGKGSRMTGYRGNKTLLPLVPDGDPYRGGRPLLIEVLQNLPPGPKAIVVNHCAQAVREATAHLPVSYIDQPVTNGTGGAVLAALPFLQQTPCERVIITMGDVPLIRPGTYRRLSERLSDHAFAVLAFEPRDKAQYGLLELEREQVTGIVEWKYWRDFPPARRNRLRYCNAGVYAAHRPLLLEFLHILQDQPHRVEKQRDGKWVTIDEYFLTDLVVLLNDAGHRITMVPTSEEEVTGVDTPAALKRVQQRYQERISAELP